MFTSSVTYSGKKEPQDMYFQATKEIIESLLIDLSVVTDSLAEQKRMNNYEHEECENARLEAVKLRDKYEPKLQFYWEREENS
jgi:hypothetical protein